MTTVEPMRDASVVRWGEGGIKRQLTQEQRPAPLPRLPNGRMQKVATRTTNKENKTMDAPHPPPHTQTTVREGERTAACQKNIKRSGGKRTKQDKTRERDRERDRERERIAPPTHGRRLS